MTTGVG